MLTPPSAILFDMDGTITEPLLDFPLIKREMGIGEEPILESLARMDPDRRRAAESILHGHEDRAAVSSTLNGGCIELLAMLAEHRIATAIITRNSRSCAARICERHGLRFGVIVTREDGRFKPDPQPVRLACQRLGVQCARTWMVGDGQYDVEAAIAAGASAIWLSHGRARYFAAEPWRTVADLRELTALLKTCLKDR